MMQIILYVKMETEAEQILEKKFMPNSAKHEIFPAHKCSNANNFSCS